MTDVGGAFVLMRGMGNHVLWDLRGIADQTFTC